MNILGRLHAAVGRLGRERLRLLGFITLAHFAIHWFMQLFPVILPTLKSSMGLDDVRVGGLTSMRMASQAALNFPSGVLADSWVHLRSFILTSSLVFMGICYWVFGNLSGYGWALLAVGLLSVGTSLFHPAAVASLSNRFPERRATAIAIYGMGATLGNTVTPLAVGILLASFSWQRVMEAQLLIALSAAGLVWIYAARMFEGDEVPVRKARPLAEMKGLARNPVFLALVLARSFNHTARQVTMTFLPIYLAEHLGYASVGLGAYLMLMSVSGLVAQPVMGVLSDRVGRKAVLGPSLLALGLAYLLIQWARSDAALALVVIAIGFLFYTVANATTAAVLDVATKSSQASAFGLTSLGTNLVVVPMPMLAGYLSVRFGILAAFVFPAVCLLAGGCLILFLRFESD